MADAKLREYAALLVQVGLNVQKGQKVVVRAPVQCADFVRLCAEAAYDAGASEVFYIWRDNALDRLHYLRADDAAFDAYPPWDALRNNILAREGAAFLSIAASDPDALQGVDPDRIRRAQQSSGAALAEYRAATMKNAARWCVASIPIEAWARKVFPGKADADAMGALWDALYKTVRVSGDGSAAAFWRAHSERSRERCAALNALRLRSLHYQNSLGTDLVVELPEGALWLGGAERDTREGVWFMPNIPTEEIFTVPKRDGVNGTVVSALPFSLNGNIIARFSFTLRDGKIVGVSAGTPEEEALLEGAISVDEGAAYLGEVALVPIDSPIANMGLLFYNTLFDENAACHFAFGNSYPCVEGAEEMDDAALAALGLNRSITHEDFMVGTADLSIIGTTRDGREVPIFINGNFAL